MSNKILNARSGGTYLSICIAAILSQGAWAQDASKNSTSAAAGNGDLEELVITGYRKSLSDSTNFKKESVGFVDGVFAEDMGKFPDTNVAESFNRIPGVTISREITGEGVNVSIRGLGTSFVKVLLNNAPISVASTGTTDSQNTNREVDLDLFPTDFFTGLTVSKSPDASMLEGGAAGTLNMRTARPFDNPGAHLSYSAQGTKQSTADKIGERGSILVSNTWGNFGALFGAAVVKNQTDVKGFESIGWTNANLSAAQCGAGNTCNTTGGGNWTIPATVPANAGNGLNTGDTIDNAFLLANNPGLTTQQIDNAIIPRLGRPSDEFGTRERVSSVLSLEYNPSDSLHFYVDSLYARKHNDMQRIDMDWVGRNGAMIPLNMKVDQSDCSNGCTVTSATFANAQFFLEYRPYTETTKLWNVNPGFEWKISDLVKVDAQYNQSESTFSRESPTVLVITPASSGISVNYTNNGTIPTIQGVSPTGLDLNNPASFGWPGGRVNIQDEARTTKTKGFRANFTIGQKELNVKFGAAYDDISREIKAFDNSQAWQNAVCGDNPNVFVPSPNSQPPCQGLSTPTPGAGYPTYPGLGTAYTAGNTTTLAYQGSLIPQTSLANYLEPGPAGFVTVDWNRFRVDSAYDTFNAQAPRVGSSNTGANGGFIGEKSTGFYVEVNGDTTISDNRLQYSVGARWVRTKQTIMGLVSIPDPRNTPAAPATPPDDGGKYPNIANFGATTDATYSNYLPSAEVTYFVSEHSALKFATSKTMTRANPNTMLPGLNFSSPSADTGTVGNPALKPFISENIDFGYEYYTGQEGYLALMGFRKRLTGFTVNGNTTVPFSALAQYGVTYATLNPTQQAAIDSRGGPSAATVTLTQQVNATGAVVVNGIELSLVQPLDFIHLPGFGIQANYTIVDQFGTGAAPGLATGVPPHTFNLVGYYEGHGISVRLSEVYNAANQASGTGQNGIGNAAIFNDAFRRWDFSSSFDLGKILSKKLPEITFDVQNVFNNDQRQYFQFTNAAYTYYSPGRYYMLGVRQKF
ncbi:MAG: TonB-dependent receptor [Solimonas sp.]